ncbi:M48 family metalloprotease [Sediminitomix flava]|uniref:Peptidase M48-like protein n=1 Tax=Sediminitomix flava TaxID=379075 RepID=A0A315ZEY6_SEDFL|nr:M48 family metalloprotease [Sediminitomix flava]PWJ43398.1 peptidase M48-like protein [Sediminitomix flava]
MKVLKSIGKIILFALTVTGIFYFYVGYIEDDALMEPEFDIQLGRQTVAGIAADTVEYPILSPTEYPEAYAYLQSLVRDLVASPEVKYKDIFKYDSVQIINNDDVLNAFCSPGGYIYVYTGLIKYLDAKDHLAGVLGHEIAHAELRHSSIRLQREYGRDKLLTLLVLTTPATIGDAVKLKLLNELTGLHYSRNQEAEADEWSVRYLKETPFACDGTAGFFNKLLKEGDNVNIPEFLSDHPDSKARVRDITALAKSEGCNTQLGDQSDWRNFQQMLPKNEAEKKP